MAEAYENFAQVNFTKTIAQPRSNDLTKVRQEAKLFKQSYGDFLNGSETTTSHMKHSTIN